MKVIKESTFSKNMLNIIYDTLMNNKEFPQFDVSKVEDSELNSDDSTITFDYNGKIYQLTLNELNKSVMEDLENLEMTDNTTVISQPLGAAEKDSEVFDKRFEEATKTPEDAPLFGAKEQPTPDDVEEPKITLEESLFEDNKSVEKSALNEASTLPKGGKDEEFDTDAWSVIYWELSSEDEGTSQSKKMKRRAKVNAPIKSRYSHVDPVNDFDLRVYASDESGFDLAKKIADAWGVEYKIEPTNNIHANKFPDEKLQMTILIPEEMVG